MKGMKRRKTALIICGDAGAVIIGCVANQISLIDSSFFVVDMAFIAAMRNAVTMMKQWQQRTLGGGGGGR